MSGKSPKDVSRWRIAYALLVPLSGLMGVLVLLWRGEASFASYGPRGELLARTMLTAWVATLVAAAIWMARDSGREE